MFEIMFRPVLLSNLSGTKLVYLVASPEEDVSIVNAALPDAWF